MHASGGPPPCPEPLRKSAWLPEDGVVQEFAIDVETHYDAMIGDLLWKEEFRHTHPAYIFNCALCGQDANPLFPLADTLPCCFCPYMVATGIVCCGPCTFFRNQPKREEAERRTIANQLYAWRVAITDNELLNRKLPHQEMRRTANWCGGPRQCCYNPQELPIYIKKGASQSYLFTDIATVDVTEPSGFTKIHAFGPIGSRCSNNGKVCMWQQTPTIRSRPNIYHWTKIKNHQGKVIFASPSLKDPHAFKAALLSRCAQHRAKAAPPGIVTMTRNSSDVAVPVVAPEAVAVATLKSPAERLKQAKELLAADLITPKMFEEKQRAILAEM